MDLILQSDAYVDTSNLETEDFYKAGDDDDGYAVGYSQEETPRITSQKAPILGDGYSEGDQDIETGDGYAEGTGEDVESKSEKKKSPGIGDGYAEGDDVPTGGGDGYAEGDGAASGGDGYAQGDAAASGGDGYAEGGAGDGEAKSSGNQPKQSQIDKYIKVKPSLTTSLKKSEGDKAKLVKSGSKSERDWNMEFQTLVEEIQKSDLDEEFEDQYLKKNFEMLHRLQVDFCSFAEKFGKIIIEEINTPENEKSVKTTSVGGVAGGVKFIWRSILFKFCLDTHNLYGGDENAAKAAGHELRSAAAYYDCQIPGLHLPLVCTLDYIGMRMVCISLIPISKGSLIYGSDDACRTVHNDDPILSEKLEAAGRILNLKLHQVKDKLLAGPFDLEGHRGVDGRYYLLDFARVFPSEWLKNSKKVMVCLLRPELVARFQRPLSSDGAMKLSPIEDRNELKEATEYLYNQLIPRFAMRLDTRTTFGDPNLYRTLTQRMHNSGINVRMLGRIYAACSSSTSRLIVMTEMVARTISSTLKRMQREIIKTSKQISSHDFREKTVHYLNLFLGSADFTRQGSPGVVAWVKLLDDLQEKFGTIENLPTPEALYTSLSKVHLCLRLEKLCSIKIDGELSHANLMKFLASASLNVSTPSLATPTQMVSSSSSGPSLSGYAMLTSSATLLSFGDKNQDEVKKLFENPSDPPLKYQNIQLVARIKEMRLLRPVSHRILDPEMRALWEEHFGKNASSVPLSDFLIMLREVCPMSLTPQMLHVLELMLTQGDRTVSVSRFNSFIGWFGSGIGKRSFVRINQKEKDFRHSVKPIRAYQLTREEEKDLQAASLAEFQKAPKKVYETFFSPNGRLLYPWFTGFISTSDAKQKLEHSKPGAFLVRLDRKDYGLIYVYHKIWHQKTTTIEEKRIYCLGESGFSFSEDGKDGCCPVLHDLLDSKGYLVALHDILFLNRENPNYFSMNKYHFELNFVDLKEVPQVIPQLSQLRTLELKCNRLTTVGQEFSCLSSLERLDLSYNNIRTLAPGLFKLTSLKELILAGHQLTELSSNISHLTNLEILNLSGMVPLVLADADHSGSITREELIEFFSTYKNIFGGFTLEKIMQLFDQYDLDKGNFLDFDEVELMDRDFRSGVPSLEAIPSELGNLVKLRELNLSRNKLQSIEMNNIENMTALMELRLDENKLQSLPSALGSLTQLKVLSLYGNPLRTPPKEIFDRGKDQILEFLRNLTLGSKSCYRTKLMFTGYGDTGKSCLIHRLVYDNFCENNHSTVGLQITNWVPNRTEHSEAPSSIQDQNTEPNTHQEQEVDVEKEKGEKAKRKLLFQTWDFGGQSLYYHSNVLFMTERAIYVVVWNAREGFENSNLEYWLNTIRSNAPGAPILIVATHLDEAPTLTFSSRDLRKEYPQIVGSYVVSSKTGEGIDVLSKGLVSTALTLSYMGEDIPSSWLMLEELSIASRMQGLNVIKWSDFVSIAAGTELSSQELKHATSFLHDLGVLLHFPSTSRTILQEYIILNPQWLSDVFILLLTSDLANHDALIPTSALASIWSKIDSQYHEILLTFMEEFEMIIRFKKNVEIVPTAKESSLPQETTSAHFQTHKLKATPFSKTASALSGLSLSLAGPQDAHRFIEAEFLLVPSRLPEDSPEISWKNILTDGVSKPSDNETVSKWYHGTKDDERTHALKEAQMTLEFDFLPPQLMNHLQVRLFAFSQSQINWKKGLYMFRNGQEARIQAHEKKNLVDIVIRGSVTQSLEALIMNTLSAIVSDCYRGVHFQVLVPCMSCLQNKVPQPFLFPVKLVRKASKKGVHHLKCHKNFHNNSCDLLLADLIPQTPTDCIARIIEVVEKLSVYYSRVMKKTVSKEDNGIPCSTCLNERSTQPFSFSFSFLKKAHASGISQLLCQNGLHHVPIRDLLMTGLTLHRSDFSVEPGEPAQPPEDPKRSIKRAESVVLRSKGVPQLIQQLTDLIETKFEELRIESQKEFAVVHELIVNYSEYANRLFVQQFRAASHDSDFPVVFVMVPSVRRSREGKSVIQPQYWARTKFLLHLLCEDPEGWHFTSHPGYPVPAPATLISQLPAYCSILVKTLTALKRPELLFENDRIRNQGIRLTEDWLEPFQDLVEEALKVAPIKENVIAAQRANIEVWRGKVLAQLDTKKEVGDLKRVRLRSGEVYYLCNSCAHKAVSSMKKSTDPFLTPSA